MEAGIRQPVKLTVNRSDLASNPRRDINTTDPSDMNGMKEEKDAY